MAVYLAAFVVGSVAILAAFLMADVGGGHGSHVELGGGGHDGLPFLSLTSLSAAVLGAGAGGLIATGAGLGTLPSALAAVASAAALLGLLQGVVLPYLRRQQSNSQRGRASYIGLLGTVTLEIPPDGWGEISFVDGDGNRVRSRAVTAEPSALTKASHVYIADVDDDAVHVVAVPDPDPLPPERP